MLVEIGTEELPPKALRGLMDAFAANLTRAIEDARLGLGDIHAYASPRRLAVLVENLDRAQKDRRTTAKGPPVIVAFDDMLICFCFFIYHFNLSIVYSSLVDLRII